MSRVMHLVPTRDRRVQSYTMARTFQVHASMPLRDDQDAEWKDEVADVS